MTIFLPRGIYSQQYYNFALGDLFCHFGGNLDLLPSPPELLHFLRRRPQHRPADFPVLRGALAAGGLVVGDLPDGAVEPGLQLGEVAALDDVVAQGPHRGVGRDEGDVGQREAIRARHPPGLRYEVGGPTQRLLQLLEVGRGDLLSRGCFRLQS